MLKGERRRSGKGLIPSSAGSAFKKCRTVKIVQSWRAISLRGANDYSFVIHSNEIFSHCCFLLFARVIFFIYIDMDG